MTNDREKRKYVRLLVIFSVIVSLGMIVWGYFESTEVAPYEVAREDIVYISSAEQLNTLTEAIYNDECYLTEDIEITDPTTTIGTDEYPFSGIFDGNGHTIYLSYTAVEKNISLFGKIAEGAVIKNVNFVINSMVVSENIGLIARLNEGTISNCTVTFSDLQISAPNAISPFVSANKGVISNVYAKGKFVNRGVNKEDEKKTATAAICIYNWGTVKNSIVEVEYSGFLSTDKQAVFDGMCSNDSMAAIVYSNVGEGAAENNRAIVSNKTYLVDNSIEFISAENRNDIFEETMVFKTLDFDNRYWTLINKTLKLILAEG